MKRAPAVQIDPSPGERSARAEPAETVADFGLGNQAMQSLIAGGLRARLDVGGADDPEEREADRLADRALAGAVASPCACGGQGCPACGGAPKIRRKAESGSAPPAAVAADFGNRAGRPLDSGTRSHFEPRFGADFSAVRIHDDPRTHRFARGIGARAFAVGSDIGFAEGRHSPGTAAGRSLLAHELAHVALGHGSVRRQLDGFGQVEPLPVSRPLLGLQVKPLPLDEPKSTGPFGLSTPFFIYDGVVVTDDREFMRGELRRLIADRGLGGARLWAMALVADGGRDSEPLIATIISFFEEVPHIPSREETKRKEEQEKAHEALAAIAIPATLSVLAELAHEAMDFLEAFERTGISITQSILKESEAKAKAELLRYGLKRTETLETGMVSDEFGVAIPDYTVTESHSMENQLPGKGLAGAAKDLIAKQAEVRKLVTRQASLYETRNSYTAHDSFDPGLYVPKEAQAEFNRLGEAIAAKKLELTLLEGIYKDRYPVLARITGDSSALAEVAKGPSAAAAKVLNSELLGTLANIEEVRSKLGGDVQIWKLPEIVAMAKSASGCNDPTSLGKMKTKLVDDKVQAVEDERFWRDMALMALTIGLALLAAIPTGGGSLAAGAAAVAGMGSFALSAFQAAEHLDQYLLEKAMAGTDLDRARAIGSSDPSLFWLAVDILGAMADLGPAIRGAKTTLLAGRDAFRTVSGAARKFVAAAPDAAAKELENLRKVAKEAEQADPKILGGLADRVVSSAQKLAEPGTSVEKTLASAAGNEAKAVAEGVAEIEAAVANAVGSAPTRLGGHTISVTPGGWLVRCSQCGMLRAEFAIELGRDDTLAARVLEVEGKAARAAATKNEALAKEAAEEASAIADQLEAIRQADQIHAAGGAAPKVLLEIAQGLRVETRGAYSFTLDELGRTKRVEGKLNLNPAKGRNKKAQKAAGGLDRKATDEGGHIIGRRFDGPTDDFNHFAQDMNFNRGAYRVMEDGWEDAISEGKSVFVEIEILYDGTSLRPSGIRVTTVIDDGIPDPVVFKNMPKGGR